jgi:tetraacyldisaccharide 4'-kinase
MLPGKRNKWLFLLYPFSLLYGLVVYIRNLLFDYQVIKSVEFDLPVICIGNITAGGTGKTPHIEYLIRLLKYEFNIACLSRGYKRKTRQYILANPGSTAEEIGDEARQIKKKFPDIHVAVDRNRVNGITRLMQDVRDLDVVLLDDAYQHRFVKPGLSILLIDYNRPSGKDYLLPAGMLREQPSGEKRADIILVTKCPEKMKPIDRRLIVKDIQLTPFQHLFFTCMKPEFPRPVFKSVQKVLTRQEIKNMKPHILMIAGIANPRSFKKFVRNYSTLITELIYPDHYTYADIDMDLIISKFNAIESTQKIIFTTEKDAMRLEKFPDIDVKIKERMYFIPVTISFLNEDTENFNQHILNYVRNNKRNSILHKTKN